MKKIVLLVLFLLVISQAAYAQRGLGPAMGGDPAKKINIAGSNEGGPISKDLREKYKEGLSGEGGAAKREAARKMAEERKVQRQEAKDAERLTGLDKAEVSGEGEKKGLERARAVANPEARELKKEVREQVREEKKEVREEIREERKLEREKVKEEYQRVKEVHKETNERLKQVRTELQACKTGEKTEECKELRQKVVDNTKEVLVSTNEKIRALIAQAQERIQNSDLPEERKAALLEKLTARITKLDELAQRAQSSEATKETVSEAARVLRQAWQESKRDLKVSVNRVAANKLHNVIEKTQHVKANLERMIAKLKEKGKNTEGLETALKNFEERMAKARTAYEQANTLLEENKDDASVDKGAQSVKESHEELKEAHEVLKTLVKDIKEQGDANE